MQLYSIHTLPQGWSIYHNIYKGYRVNMSFMQCLISIFNRQNNEFWMIWTDIFPVLLYSCMYLHWLHSPSYEKMDAFYRILAKGTYVAALASRGCSLIYHIFNPLSLQVNRTLINIDYMGITCMMFGFPWIYVNALHIQSYNDDRFVIFIYGLASCFLCISSFLVWSTYTSLQIQQPIIITASIGTATSFLVLIDTNTQYIWKFHCASGTFCFLFGYIAFYRLHIPDSIYNCLPVFYSHIFWHNIVTLGQYMFLCTTFLENNTT